MMKNVVQTMAGALLLTLAPLVQAADAAVDQLASLISGVQTYAANFEQTVKGARNAKGEQSRGEFQLERPGKFRWETSKPYRQILISTGREMWAYEPDIDSATVQDVEQGLGATPALLLSSSAAELTRSFKVEAKGEGQFLLTPKDGGSSFEEVVLQFEGRLLKELQLADSLGNHTLVRFSDVRLNDAIPAARFQFTPGKNVDVIDNRKGR